MASILEVLYNGSAADPHLAGGCGITHLMFVTQITWASLIPFLEELIEKEMITAKVMPGMKIKSRRNHRVFSITQKGIRFLTLYKELKACLGS